MTIGRKFFFTKCRPLGCIPLKKKNLWGADSFECRDIKVPGGIWFDCYTSVSQNVSPWQTHPKIFYTCLYDQVKHISGYIFPGDTFWLPHRSFWSQTEVLTSLPCNRSQRGTWGWSRALHFWTKELPGTNQTNIWKIKFWAFFEKKRSPLLDFVQFFQFMLFLFSGIQQWKREARDKALDMDLINSPPYNGSVSVAQFNPGQPITYLLKLNFGVTSHHFVYCLFWTWVDSARRF